MKQKLLIILGAGSSLECGMPSVSEINTLMHGWAARAANELAVPDYYSSIWQALEAHLSQGFQTGRVSPDFERALSDLLALMHWVRPAPAGGALRALAASSILPPGLHFPNLEPYGPYVSVKMLLSRLLAALAQHMRGLSRDLDPQSISLRSWRAVMDGLRSHFDIAIYNLNYDCVARTCWPEAFTGFDASGRFDPRALHERDWAGLMHLHGSVHFALRDPLGENIVWRNDLGGSFSDCDDRSANERSDGRDFPATTLIAGGFKLDQLLTEPFNSYQSALVRDAARADAVLIGGYGFTDAHVNRALKNALRRRSPRPPVLVLDWAEELTDPLSFRNDRWSYVLRDTLYAAGDFAEPRRRAPTPPSELKARETCECSPHHRVAIWYGGFLGAANVIDRLGSWLNGGDDELLAPVI